MTAVRIEEFLRGFRDGIIISGGDSGGDCSGENGGRHGKREKLAVHSK